MLFNINAEFAHSLDQRPIALRAGAPYSPRLPMRFSFRARLPASRPISRTCAMSATS